MDLTRDQRAAAEVCGCTFEPATDDQVRRLTVQRRIFRVEGKPFVAVRDGSHEAHATLAALIAERMRSVLAKPAEAEEAQQTSEGEASGDAAEGRLAAQDVDATDTLGVIG